MDIGVPVRDLGKVDCEALIERVKGLPPSAWDECDIRQKSFDVHRQTKSIVLLFSRLWPNLNVQKYHGWPLLSDVVLPVIQQVLMAHYPDRGFVIRAMVANLVAGGRIGIHMDSDHSFEIGHRIHVPLQTNPGVRFQVDGHLLNLKVGNAYEINNVKYHAVENRGDEDRYHLIFDYVPPSRIAQKQA